MTDDATWICGLCGKPCSFDEDCSCARKDSMTDTNDRPWALPRTPNEDSTAGEFAEFTRALQCRRQLEALAPKMAKAILLYQRWLELDATLVAELQSTMRDLADRLHQIGASDD